MLMAFKIFRIINLSVYSEPLIACFKLVNYRESGLKDLFVYF